MLYTDLIFVFAFLPITVIISLFDRSAEYKNLILVISSVIFFTWGRPALILLLFATSIADYLFGLGAAKDNRLVKNLSLFADAAMNIAAYVVFAHNGLFRSGGGFSSIEFLAFSDKLIPLGIAFYTLRGMSYVFDVYHKRISAEKNPFCILTYMVSYHFMPAGPIVRYADIKDEIRKRRVTATEINDGVTRFIFGLGKAAVLAPLFRQLMEQGLVFSNLSTMGAWLGMLGFFGYIYWGLAGYTDMALGLGLMNGFHYPENVFPLRIGKHITGLVSGFNATLYRFFSLNTVYQGENRALYSLTVLISAALAGLWYGFGKGAVAGALLFGICIIAEKLLLKKIFDSKPPVLGDFYTIVFALAGASLFYFDSLTQLRQWLLACVGKGSSGSVEQLKELVSANRILLIVGTLAALPIVTDIFAKLAARLSKSVRGYGAVRTLKTAAVLLIFFVYTVQAYNIAG